MLWHVIIELQQKRFISIVLVVLKMSAFGISATISPRFLPAYANLQVLTCTQVKKLSADSIIFLSAELKNEAKFWLQAVVQ